MPDKNNSDAQLWRGAIIPSLITALICLILLSFINGKSGAIGAALASITVIIFFSIHLIVARVSRNLDPITTMALAMFSYFAKVIFMGVFLFLVTKYTERSTVDRGSFAICAILITMAWLLGEIRSFLKLRAQLPLPKIKGD
jgi:ATP synthase protein I